MLEKLCTADRKINYIAGALGDRSFVEDRDGALLVSVSARMS